MEKKSEITLLGRIWCFLRKCLYLVLSYGPMPNHIAFILDGNRRFARRRDIKREEGHRAGFSTVITTLEHCCEMGVKYVTVYAFSIANFNREPEEVQSIMDLLVEVVDKLLEEESIVNKYGVRINFWGNLKLLCEPMRVAAEKAMARTAKHEGPVLSICLAYTSTDEIMHAIEEAAIKKINSPAGDTNISVADLEKHLYSSECPDPDIVIRTSGVTRLSNFLLWQTAFSHFRTPVCLWPEFSLAYLIWALLEHQKVYPYLNELRSKTKKNH